MRIRRIGNSIGDEYFNLKCGTPDGNAVVVKIA